MHHWQHNPLCHYIKCHISFPDFYSNSYLKFVIFCFWLVMELPQQYNSVIISSKSLHMWIENPQHWYGIGNFIDVYMSTSTCVCVCDSRIIVVSFIFLTFRVLVFFMVSNHHIVFVLETPLKMGCFFTTNVLRKPLKHEIFTNWTPNC